MAATDDSPGDPVGSEDQEQEAELNGARSSKRMIWLGTGLLSAILAAFVGWISLQSYGRAMEVAEASVQNIALVLEAHTSGTVQAVDTVLQVALHEETAFRDRQSDIIGQLLVQNPNVNRLSILDFDTGRLVQSYGDARDSTSVDVEAWKAHQAEPGFGIHIGQPNRRAYDGAWFVNVSLRQLKPQGGSLIAVAHVGLAELQHIYDAIKVGEQGAIALFRADGVLIARKPYNTSHIGRHFQNTAVLERIRRAPSGVYDSFSVTDGIRRIIAYRQIESAPLVIIAALSRNEVLAPWRNDLVRNLGLLAMAIAVMAAIAARFSREASRRDQAEAQAREKSSLLEATLENMDQGLLMVDQDLTVPICNRRAIELLGLPPDLMARRPSFEEVTAYQYRTGEFVRAEQPFRAWVRSRGFERKKSSYERERPDGTVLEVRTVPLANGGAVRTYTDITARRQADRQIAHMALHDALTDLPNRVLFRERLEGALAKAAEERASVALLCLDLDLFKAVNDSLGHALGDALLVAVAQRIAAHLSAADTVARLGGDEFAILQITGDQPARAEALARALTDTIGQPFAILGHEVNVGASVGIALAPQDSVDPDQLLINADLALYRAKSDGRGTFRFFEPGMDAEMQRRRLLELDLRDALAKGEFELQYHPYMDVASAEIAGFEARLRWRHPARGVVPTAEFLPVAEETGLVVALGEWMLRQACAEAATWPAGVRVAVNVSAAQFWPKNLVQVVMSALATSRLAADRLEIEITETVLMRSAETSLQALRQLGSFGVRIVLDEFGTGYSSLSWLRNLPIDKIKIDRSLVRELDRDPDCAAIIRATLSLAARLRVATAAEGVETRSQLDFLRAEDCTEIQGPLLSPPKPAHETLAALGRRTVAAA